MGTPLMLKVNVDDKGNPVLENMQTNITKLNKKTKGLGKTLTHVFGSAVMLQGLAKFRQAMVYANQEVLQFNKIMKQTEGITGTVGKPLDMLKTKILDVSNTTEISSTKLATAVLNISKMGFNLKQSLEVVPHLANLATSSTSDLEEVTQIAVQTMKSFQMEAKEMEHIVNVIQGTVSKTAIGFLDYAESMKFVAPIAKTMNISLEQTSAMIGVLGDIGIKGSLGGTTLKNMFLNIMKPSDKVRKILEGLNEEGLTFNKILKAMDESGVGVKDFLETFNKRAVAGSLALSQLTEKTEALEEVLVNDAVKAAEVAEIIREAWIPQLQILRNTFVNTFVLMGEILDQSNIGLGIRGITDEFINLQNWLKENPEQLERFATQIADLAKVSATVLSKGFSLFIKNLDLLKNAAKAFIALKLSDNIFAISKNMSIAGKSTKGFMGAINTHGAKSLNYLTGILLAAQGIASLITMYQDKKLDEQSQRLENAFGESEKQLKNQMNVLNEFKDLWITNAQVILNAREKLDQANKGSINLSKLERNELEKTIQISESMIQRGAAIKLAEKHEFSIEFFKQLKSVDKINTFMGVLDKRLLAIQNKKKILDDINNIIKDVDKFTKPDISQDETKGKQKKWWEEQHEHLLASARLAESIAKSLKLGHKPSTVMGAFAGQLEGAGVKIGLQSVPVSPLRETKLPGEPFGEISAINLIAKDIDFAINQITTFKRVNQDMLAAALTVASDIDDANQKSHDNWKKIIEEKGTSYQEWINDMGVSFDLYLAKEAEQEQRRIEELRDYRFEQLNIYLEAAQMQNDMIQMIQDSGLEKSRAKMEEETRLFEENSTRRLKAVEGNAFKTAIVEKQIAADKAKLVKEQEKLEKEQLNKRRVWSMIEVAINTAVGVSAALRGTPPASYVLAAITAAMGLTQLGLISNQDSYRFGGFTGHGRDSDEAGTVHKEEYVVDANTLRLLGGADSVEEMIEARVNDTLGSAGGNNYFYFDTIIGEEEYVRDMSIKVNRELQRHEV